MVKAPNDPLEPELDMRAHLLACIPLFALAVVAAWLVIASPSSGGPTGDRPAERLEAR